MQIAGITRFSLHQAGANFDSLGVELTRRFRVLRPFLETTHSAIAVREARASNQHVPVLARQDAPESRGLSLDSAAPPHCDLGRHPGQPCSRNFLTGHASSLGGPDSTRPYGGLSVNSSHRSAGPTCPSLSSCDHLSSDLRYLTSERMVIEQDSLPVAVLKAPQVKGRRISEVIAALEAHGANAVLDGSRSIQ